MERNVIVPIDFSAASQNAYRYATQFAKKYQANIKVVHVTKNIVPAKNQLRSEVIGQLEEKLVNFISDENVTDFLDGNIGVETKIGKQLLEGNPVKEIIGFCEKMTNPIIVMGSTGSHNAIEKMFGSVSSKVAQKSTCPVLLIPKNAEYVEYENILYATNFDSAYSKMVNKMLQFASSFKAALHFIQCRKIGQPMKYKSTEDRIKNQVNKNGTPEFPIIIKTIEVDTPLNGLSDYADKENIDLIVMVNTERGYLESFLGKSITKKMALRTTLPLMVYHM